MKRIVLSLLIGFAAVIAVSAENWPAWRGPQANGVSGEKNVPLKWSTDENIAWKLAMPSRSGATPIIWGDRIFLTSVVSAGETEKPAKGLYFGGERPASSAEHRWMVTAIDFTSGRTVWSREAHRAPWGRGLRPG